MKLINTEIRFEVTNICNAKCIMCPREKMKRRQGTLDLELYKKVLDEAVDMGCKYVCLENFGESFIDPYIFERAKYAKHKGLEVYTVTNASLLDEEKCNGVLDFFDKVRISMYGITEKTYEAIHKGLVFKEVKENVTRLFQMRKQRCSKLKIEMYFLLMEENRHEVDIFIKQYKDIADTLSVWKPHNWGGARSYRKIHSKKESCGRPMRGPIQVQWDGLVVPCCFDYDSKIVLGDLKNHSLSEVLHSESYNALRRAHQEGDFSKFAFCNLCDQLNKNDDILVYSTGNLKVGAIYSTGFDLLGNPVYVKG